MSTLRIAWRNLMRNRRRSAITITAVLLNTAILISSGALITGLLDQTIRNATQLSVGDVQVHAKGYRSDRSQYTVISRPDEILRAARAAGFGGTARAFGYGLVSVGPKSAGASFWGVDPAAERASFRLPARLAEGRYIGADPAQEAVIGRKLARSLAAKVGAELVVVVQAADGSLGNELFTVVGILETTGSELDRAGVIIHQQDYQSLFVSEGRIHEIALRAPTGLSAEAAAERLRGLLAAVAPTSPPLEVQTWREILPAVSDMQNLSGASMWIFGTIFLLAAGLGVLNTMLMATHDRVREYGLIKALGSGPGRIVRDVLVEALVLATVANLAGAALGIAASLYLQVAGIDLSALGGGDMTFSGVAFDPVWRATLRPAAVVQAVIATTVACVLASLYPAIKAARLRPVLAMTQV